MGQLLREKCICNNSSCKPPNLYKYRIMYEKISMTDFIRAGMIRFFNGLAAFQSHSPNWICISVVLWASPLRKNATQKTMPWHLLLKFYKAEVLIKLGDQVTNWNTKCSFQSLQRPWKHKYAWLSTKRVSDKNLKNWLAFGWEKHVHFKDHAMLQFYKSNVQKMGVIRQLSQT